MKMEMYLSQSEVFTLGILSLFPERLEKQVIVAGFGPDRYIFSSQNDDDLGNELRYYQKKGYFQYELVPLLSTGLEPEDRPPLGFMISNVDSQRATDDLTEYLEKWQQDKLTTRLSNKPADFSHQETIFVNALARAYAIQKKPVIKLSDLSDDSSSHHEFVLPFWELILSYQLINGQLAIINMDYAKVTGNEYTQPFAEINITNVDLRRKLDLLSKSSEPISDIDPQEHSYKGLLASRDGLIHYNGKEIPLSAQQRSIMRIFLKRPEELCSKEAFIDASANVFSGENYPNINATLAKLIAAVHTQLQVVVGQRCIFNTPDEGWKLKID